MSTPARNLTDLYRQIVLDHSRQPRNQRRPDHFDREAEGHNPLCGDKVRVFLGLQEGRLNDVAFEASGCAICIASASLMTEAARGHTTHEAIDAAESFITALSTDGAELDGDLAALSGVSQYPSRIRCATLPWKALQAALGPSPISVSTE